MSVAWVGLGVSVLLSASSASDAASAQSEASSRSATITNAQTQASNMNIESDNIEKSARGHLARYMVGVNNKRLMRNAGTQYNAAQVNIARTKEAFIAGSLEGKIRNAQEAGALSAHVALAGVGGGAVDQIAQTMRLKQSRQRAAQEQKYGQVVSDQKAQADSVMTAAIGSLDMGSLSDGLNNTKAVAPSIGPSPDAGRAGLMAGIGALASSPYLKTALGSIFSDTNTGSGVTVYQQGSSYYNAPSSWAQYDTGPATGVGI